MAIQKNGIRSGEEIATIASHVLANRLDDATLDRIVDSLHSGVQDRDSLIDEIAQSLAGSVLANRRK